ncbi:ribonuclease E/G [Galactobacter valiniphilus]|uniref:Ribonuclease E n=1 Tax=Galactobacter valiniphilus TaxID=2676122 RepID=A0A399J9P4_9MICC|nr:Rne/Rng family ribonuclease [Galactobacter valiniphilus]RII41237.1 ribonuclease E/G [Galactobacter valiniphilus]
MAESSTSSSTPARRPRRAAGAPAGSPSEAIEETAAEATTAKKASAKKAPAKKTASKSAATAKAAVPAAEAAEAAPAKKATRKPAAKNTKASAAADDAVVAAVAETGTAAEPAEATPAKKAPARRSRAKKVAEPVAETAEAPAEEPVVEVAAEEQAPAKKAPARRSRAKKVAEPVAETAEAPAEETPAEETAPAESAAVVEPSTGGTEDAEEAAAEAAPEPVVFDPFAIPESLALVLSTAPEASDDEDAPEEGTRRRRRRRRGTEDMEIEGGNETDPPGTITRVRAPRAASEKPIDHVVSIKGSTRLEAKRQRRRESRESGRRRHGITEAEFLARRESVDRKMVVRQKDERIQIGVLEDGVLAEHFVSHTTQDSMIGNVYVGKVQNVLPSMEAAFVDIGRGRNAVLYAGEVDWDAAKLDGKPRRIENALKSGDTVLVQVTKDPVGHKGARLTSQISLPGRYLVFVPGGSMTGISRKLPDVERNRLKKILKDHLPEKAGVIVRTAAEGAAEQELMNDINRLRVQWEGILKASTSTKTRAPELLYAEPDLTIKVVRDVFNEDFSQLIVQGEHAWDTIEAYVTYVAPDLVDRLHQWDGEGDAFTELRIDEQIRKALDRKVNLPSGGSLVIDRTEAMTVIDVNTGKFTGSGGNLEETVTKNNLEAAEEIVRQMRLRDMGGIIVVDFIDMVLESNRDLVLRRLVECLGRDRTKHQVAEVTSLGLVQMTRKKIGTGLLEVFSEPCDHCDGRGVVLQDEPLAGRSRPQQVHVPSDRPTRSERRKNNGNGSSNNNAQAKPVEAAAAATPAAPAPESSPEEAERAQKARAALASIAAASTHGAEHGAEQAASAHAAEPEQANAAGEPFTEAGEDDKPRRRRRRGRRGRGGRGTGEESQGQEPGDSASEESAFEVAEAIEEAPAAETVQIEASEAPVAAPAVVQESAREQAASAARPTTRRRARRVASSEQGSSTTTVAAAAEAQGTVAVSAAATPVKAAPVAEPVMLGVGVPASEL